MTVDPTKIKPVPIQKTLLLVNNFVVNTCNFLQSFSETCEKKVSTISAKVTELETLLAVLEAKLGSIPGLEYSNSDLPSTQSNEKQEPPPSVNTASLPSVNPTSPNPPAAEQTNPTTSETALIIAPSPDASAAAAPGKIAAKDHPDYLPFFKLLKVGVPAPVVQAKVTAAGLNAELIDTPDALIDVASLVTTD